MNRSSSISGLLRHFLLTLQLNFRSPQALVYGYLVPIFFLLAFGSVFRSDTPLLLGKMGQLLTITILGGACFGLPTALVAERERGVWRRYRLLPVPTGSLVLSTLLVRLIIVGSAVVMQIFLARLIYGTPLPLHPGQAVVGFLVVASSFLGLGLLIAALANDVPAVQALGQCIFLPMIMIGGVGVPLVTLPAWAQKISGFMPGRYAVDVLQASYATGAEIHHPGFSLLALVVIGGAAGLVGAKLFRWEAGRRIDRTASIWIAIALIAWLAVGLTASATGRLKIILPPNTGYMQITDEQMNAITYDDLPGDNELATRLAPPLPLSDQNPFVEEFVLKLQAWPPGQIAEPGQQVRNLLSVAAIADISADLHEAEIGRIVFNTLQARHGRAELRRILAWIILTPNEGEVITQIPELEFRRQPSERVVRERSVLYAKKYLGRLIGRIAD